MTIPMYQVPLFSSSLEAYDNVIMPNVEKPDENHEWSYADLIEFIIFLFLRAQEEKHDVLHWYSRNIVDGELCKLSVFTMKKN
jgi:hypothetical protein